MPRKGVNVSLSSYDDIFSTEQSRTEAGQEHVQEIPLEELHPFEGHPFKVLDNEEMDKTGGERPDTWSCYAADRTP